MQVQVELLALPFVDAASAILCAACLAPAHLSCSWCQFLLWVSFGPWGVSSICCCVLFCFCCRFCWRAAAALSCGGACSGRSRCCFCNSMCCLPCSCAFKLQLVPVPALGLVGAVGYEQHLLLLLLFFLFFLLRAADALSCGGACSGRSRCCFCNSMCCLSCSCALKLQLVPVPALGFGAGSGV